MLELRMCSWVLAGLCLQWWVDDSTTFKGKTFLRIIIILKRQHLNQSADMPQAV